MPGHPKGLIDKLGRECASCGHYKTWEHYAKNVRERSGHQTRCKECMRPQLAANQVRRRERLRKIIWRAKDCPCADCGGKYPPWVMDFDHDPDQDKVTHVSMLLSFTEATLVAEIAKCTVVCSNCHRMRTHARGQYVSDDELKGGRK